MTNDTLNLAINNPTYFHFVYYLSSPPLIGGGGLTLHFDKLESSLPKAG